MPNRFDRVRDRLVNLLTAGLLAAAGFLSIYFARNLQFHTGYVFAAVLLLLGFGTLFDATVVTRHAVAASPAAVSKVFGALFLVCFFYFFVWGFMLWSGAYPPVFQPRLLIFAATASLLTGVLHLYQHFSATTDYLRRLHANTFYFGLTFMMAAGMMKYRDPSRVDTIGTVSISIFCLIQAIGLLKTK